MKRGINRAEFISVYHLKELFLEYGIHYDNKQFSKNMKIKVKEASINHEIVIIDVHWGYFKMPIKILNITDFNIKHEQIQSSGNYSNVYIGTFLGKLLALKCLPIQTRINRRKAIQELFITKVASVLKVGPRLNPVCGFDIFFSKNCS